MRDGVSSAAMVLAIAISRTSPSARCLTRATNRLAAGFIEVMY